jgi:hypothetical protein
LLQGDFLAQILEVELATQTKVIDEVATVYTFPQMWIETFSQREASSRSLLASPVR